jgi:hypothetical protein
MKRKCLQSIWNSRRLLYRMIILAVLLILDLNTTAQLLAGKKDIFNRDKLVAWCIVPFDSKKRGPEERSQMLNDLGITKLAYDWRDYHIPTFDSEIDALEEHHIDLQAFWLMSDTGVTNNWQMDAVFSLLTRRHIKTQIWYCFFPPKGFENLTQDQKVAEAAKAVAVISRRAYSIGCTVGLYNHNGWYGEPENQLAIIKELNLKNLGIVYNFNHAQDQTESFAKFYPLILPHLIAINLAGLKKGDQHIYPITKTGAEKMMIDIILRSDYAGPIGIINEDTDPDAAVGLQKNMDGLRDILMDLGYKKVADSFSK